MHRTSNSVLRRLIQCWHRTLNKTVQDGIQRAMRSSNIIIDCDLWCSRGVIFAHWTCLY